MEVTSNMPPAVAAVLIPLSLALLAGSVVLLASPLTVFRAVVRFQYRLGGSYWDMDGHYKARTDRQLDLIERRAPRYGDSMVRYARCLAAFFIVFIVVFTALTGYALFAGSPD
jgi:hypothetical protein